VGKKTLPSCIKITTGSIGSEIVHYLYVVLFFLKHSFCLGFHLIELISKNSLNLLFGSKFYKFDRI
jgi:hypothetical protein